MPFAKPPAKESRLWIADLTLKQKYAALYEIHKLANHPASKNTPSYYKSRSNCSFDEATCVYWSDSSYALQGYDVKRFDNARCYRAEWVTEPLRVVNLDGLI